MTTTDERCEHSGLLKSACAHCMPVRGRHHRSPAVAAGDIRGPWFTARFDSDCAGPCGSEIQAGDDIRADGEGGYLCRDCGSD